MESTNLHIKNMVCPRCILVIEKELSELGARVLSIELGHVTITIPSHLSIEKIDKKLKEFGFELLDDKEEVTVEQIKIIVLSFIEKLEMSQVEVTLSEYLGKEIGKNYNYLSKLFSKRESQTIENYYIQKRIGRVKELLDYDELSLSEIAVKLGYSSVHYLSSQFRKVTGLSVSEHKKEIEQLHDSYDSISEALNDLKGKGFIYDFNRKEDLLECKELGSLFHQNDVEINEVYRFKETSTKYGRSAVYLIDAGDGLKGVLVESNNET